MEPLAAQSGRIWPQPGFRRKRLHPGYGLHNRVTSVIYEVIRSQAGAWERAKIEKIVT